MPVDANTRTSVALAGRAGQVENYAAALRGAGLTPVVTLDARALDACAGLLLPGGGDIDPALYGAENRACRDIDRALDEAQLALADAFIRAGRPVLGICRGLQILNVALGGDLIQDLPTARAHTRHDGKDSVHPCTALPGSAIAALYGERFSVNSSHHQALARMGGGLRATSFAPDGAVESAGHDALPILGVQWHPERCGFALARPDAVDGAAVFRLFRRYLERM